MRPIDTSFNSSASARSGASVSPHEAFRVWARIAALSFGGPAGQIAVMHRILVDEKRWISESRFLHALNYCMLLPGPEAQQLATYIGWLMHGTRGGILAGGLFILPGVVAIMALSWVYALYGNVGLIAGLFFGLKAAVLAIVLEAVVRISRRALKSNLLVGIAATAFVMIFAFQVPFPLIVLGAGLLGFAGGRAGWRAFPSAADRALADSAEPTVLGDATSRPRPSTTGTLRVAGIWLMLWLLPVVLLIVLLGSGSVFSQIAVFFSKMATVTFGGAYAALAYVAQQAVEHYGWLKPGEMLDGLGMAETTPGPLIMVLQFVGFLAAFREPGGLPPLLAGTLGGLLGHLGDVRALLPVDLPRSALYRNHSRESFAERRALGHYGGGRRRDPQSGDMVCHPHHLWPSVTLESRSRACGHSGSREREFPRIVTVSICDTRDVSVQAGCAAGPGRLLACRNGTVRARAQLAKAHGLLL